MNFYMKKYKCYHMSPCARYYSKCYHSHFIGEEIEAQGGQVTCLRQMGGRFNLTLNLFVGLQTLCNITSSVRGKFQVL